MCCHDGQPNADQKQCYKHQKNLKKHCDKLDNYYYEWQSMTERSNIMKIMQINRSSQQILNCKKLFSASFRNRRISEENLKKVEATSEKLQLQ